MHTRVKLGIIRGLEPIFCGFAFAKRDFLWIRRLCRPTRLAETCPYLVVLTQSQHDM